MMSEQRQENSGESQDLGPSRHAAGNIDGAYAAESLWESSTNLWILDYAVTGFLLLLFCSGILLYEERDNYKNHSVFFFAGKGFQSNYVIEGEVQRWAEGDQGKPDNQPIHCADRSSNPGIN